LRRLLPFIALSFIGSGIATQKTLSIPEIADRSKHAVALIVTSDKAGNPISSGTCFSVSADGRLVTNFHVIEGAASAIVKFPNGALFTVRGVIGADQTHDLAVLQADGSDFAYLHLEDSEPRVGEAVVALGNPEELEYTVSNGIVSAIRKEASSALIQTTAPISHGSSGGRLLNMRGLVIGVTTLIHTKAQNANFAVPSRYVNALLARVSGEPVQLEYSALLAQQSERRPAPTPAPALATPEVWLSLQSAPPADS
jgi:S1-C subfamily serine protease